VSTRFTGVHEGADELTALRAEHRRVIGSMEYAYASGSLRTLGDDPRLHEVLERAAELERRIAALERGR